MSRGVRVRVWGDLALFSRPEMTVERCSYCLLYTSCTFFPLSDDPLSPEAASFDAPDTSA